MLRLPSGSNRRITSRRNSPRPGLGIALSRASSGYVSSDRISNHSEPLQKEHALREGETIDEIGLQGRPIYIIRSGGQPTGVRKVAHIMSDRPGYFDATRHEAMIYSQIISANPSDWNAHLIPYRTSYATREAVIIDFDWIEGSDVESYLQENQGAAATLFDKAAQQLRWLASLGYTHGDITAGNFFRSANGRVLILDLGKAHKRINVIAARNEKTAFINMIRPFVKEKVVQRLEAQPMMMGLPEFYLLASRRLRKSTRATRKRTNH